jgi:hypothetical protein
MHAIDAESSILENEFNKSYKMQKNIPTSISISTTKDKSIVTSDDSNHKKKEKKRKHDKNDGKDDHKKKKKHNKDE